MSQHDLREHLRRLLLDDARLRDQLREAGLLPGEEESLSLQHLETARVVRTLIHELEINWPGVEVILRMRTELLATRQQVSELAQLLRELQR